MFASAPTLNPFAIRNQNQVKDAFDSRVENVTLEVLHGRLARSNGTTLAKTCATSAVTAFTDTIFYLTIFP